MPLRWPHSDPEDDPQRRDEADLVARDANHAAPERGPDSELANKERWRLAWHYGEMADGELEALAAEAGSLTEVARRALQSELNKRGLPVELQAPAAAVTKALPESRKLVTLRRFRDMPEALLAKSVLESAGIDCALADANIIRTDWLWSNMLGGIKLRVQEEDLEAASNLLNQNSPEPQGASGGELAELACPRCSSADLSLEDSHEPPTNAGRLVFSAAGDDPTWICHSCGHSWQDADFTE